MPDIDGVTLMTMMRNERPQDRTPIAALTANVLPQEAERLLSLGFDYYLGKPIDEKKFRSLVDGSLARSNAIPDALINNEQTNDTTSVDIKLSLELAANNESLLQQILELLLRDIPHYKDELANAVQPADYSKLSKITHKIQGVTCYACLPRLKSQVQSIQQQLSSNPIHYLMSR